ncbi:MAG: hypothetical protein AB3N28_06760 [Kordiimonas sp.]
MVSKTPESQPVLLDPDTGDDCSTPDSFDHTIAIKAVDDRILSLAALLGKQAAREFLQRSAANDNEPPCTQQKDKP